MTQQTTRHRGVRSETTFPLTLGEPGISQFRQHLCLLIGGQRSTVRNSLLQLERLEVVLRNLTGGPRRRVQRVVGRIRKPSGHEVRQTNSDGHAGQWIMETEHTSAGRIINSEQRVALTNNRQID